MHDKEGQERGVGRRTKAKDKADYSDSLRVRMKPKEPNGLLLLSGTYCSEIPKQSKLIKT